MPRRAVTGLEEPEYNPRKNRKADDFRPDCVGDSYCGAADTGRIGRQGYRRERASQFKSLSLFCNEADAQKQCPVDTVVWGSSAHIGVYFVKGAGPQRIAGYYACMADAKKAGYQIGE